METSKSCFLISAIQKGNTLMGNASNVKSKLLICLMAATVLVLTVPLHLPAQGTQSGTTLTQSQLVERIKELEQQLAKLAAAAPAPAQTAQQNRPATPPPQQPPMQMPMPAATQGPLNPENTPPDSTDPQALLDRIKALEQRIKDLESSAVLSEPETRVKKLEVYVDKDGNLSDTPTEGAKKRTTFQRERVYRRQTINEKIEEALADAEEHNVKLGVDAGITFQYAKRTQG